MSNSGLPLREFEFGLSIDQLSKLDYHHLDVCSLDKYRMFQAYLEFKQYFHKYRSSNFLLSHQDICSPHIMYRPIV